MRYLAIDLGDKRTGLASGDDTTGLVTPLTVVDVPRGERLLDALVTHIADHAPDVLVIGLPVNMDGSIGPAAEMVLAFGASLADRTKLPIVYQDERLTSFAADAHLVGTSRRTKRRLQDALAAAEILRDHLADGASGGESTG